MRTKRPIEITAEAFSVHTIELCCHPTMKEFHRTIDRLFTLSRKMAHKGMFLLPSKHASSKTHSCILFADQGVSSVPLYPQSQRCPSCIRQNVYKSSKIVGPLQFLLGNHAAG